MSLFLKNKIYLVVAALFLVATAFMLTGVFLIWGENTPNGIFFRKTYGYVGVDKTGIGFLNLSVFNFGNQDMLIFQDSKNFKFDTDNVIIKEMNVERNFAKNELELFSINVHIQALQEGVHIVSKLQSTEVDFVEYEIGAINIEVMSNASERPSLNYSVGSHFYDNQYNFSISSPQFEIVVTDIIFSHNKIIDSNYKTILPSQSQIDMELRIDFLLNFSVDKFDIFILQPIVKFNILNEDNDFYLFMLIPTQYILPMTILEMKEYVQND